MRVNADVIGLERWVLFSTRLIDGNSKINMIFKRQVIEVHTLVRIRFKSQAWTVQRKVLNWADSSSGNAGKYYLGVS